MSDVAEVAVNASATSAARPARRPATLGRLVAAMLLAATAPLWAIAALAAWASVGRPLLFRQIRSGLDARPFTIVKFRTMREMRDGAGALLPDAARETPATKLMRRIRIDELPQLVSIARGDMAFVGPRPLLPATIAGFEDLGRLRCTVSPGLTGWAQVNGNTRLTDREKLALDLWYVTHRSVWLDARILVLTAVTLLRGERVCPGNLARAAAETPAARLFAAVEVAR